MEEEILKVFDGKQKQIGHATREEVHRLGLWHETFHCWVVTIIDSIPYIYLQLRSPYKKNYPDLLDITVAGHLLENEAAGDGIREIKEEIGLEVKREQLVTLGILSYEMKQNKLIDREFAHTYLYKQRMDFDDFILQEEEVAGMFRVKWQEFSALWKGEAESLEISGFIIKEGNRHFLKQQVNKANFVPHPTDYYVKLIQLLEEYIG